MDEINEIFYEYNQLHKIDKVETKAEKPVKIVTAQELLGF